MERNSLRCECLLPRKRTLRLYHHEGLLSEIYCRSYHRHFRTELGSYAPKAGRSQDCDFGAEKGSSVPTPVIFDKDYLRLKIKFIALPDTHALSFNLNDHVELNGRSVR